MTDTLNISLAQQIRPRRYRGNIAKIRMGRAEAKAQAPISSSIQSRSAIRRKTAKPAFQEACESR
jgi:hypothetical protein